MLSKLSLLALAALLLLSSVAHVAAQAPSVFSLGIVGVASPQPNTLLIAAPLANLTNQAVADVKIDHIQLAAAPVETPWPMTVGAVPARSSVIVQAEVDSQSLLSGHRYTLVIQGTYRGHKDASRSGHEDASRGGDKDASRGDHEDASRRFRVYAFVVIPPPSEGSDQLGTIQVPPHYVEGGRYPPQPPRMDKDVNSGAPPVPTNPAVPGAPTPTDTAVQPAPK
jgi:hypothetical protein